MVALLAAALSFAAGSSCIALERSDASPGDVVAGDATTDESIDDGASDAPADAASDGPSDGHAGCDAGCPQQDTPCRFWACNPGDGQCEEVPKPDGTSCGAPCAAACQAGECQPGTGVTAPGHCSASSPCASSPCGTFTCDLDSCSCQLVEQGDGPLCCLGGGCGHLSGPPGCESYSCDPTTNACVPQEWDPQQCLCETNDHCGAPVDPCRPWVCDPIDGCLEEVLGDCVACVDDADCVDAASQLGACFEGTCGDDGVCEVSEDPTCEVCTSPADCVTGTACETATCDVGACAYEAVQGCALCDTADECPEPPPCYLSWCPLGGGVCQLVEQTTCPDSCSADVDCDDGDPCTQNTCDVTQTCTTTELPICSQQNCSNQGVVSQNSAAGAGEGALVKVAGHPALGMVTEQQVATCGDNAGTIQTGPVAIASGVEVINTSLQDGTPWQCTDTCGTLDCAEPIVGVRYWVWGVLGANVEPVVDVAGWCLEIDTPNILGSYSIELSEQGTGSALSSEASIQESAGLLAMIPNISWLKIDGLNVNAIAGEMSFNVKLTGGPWSGDGQAVLVGAGNSLWGQLVGELGASFSTLDIVLTRL